MFLHNYTLAVIIPVFNAEKYLYTTLKSLIENITNDIRIIIINDGSTDNSLNICKEFSQKVSGINIISQKNEGPSAARNAALANVKEKYVTFLDADDAYEPKTLKSACNYLADNPTDVLFLQVKRITVKKKTTYTVKFDNIEKKTGAEVQRLWCHGDKRICGYSWGKIYNRNLLEGIQFPQNMRFAEDMYFLTDIIAKIQNAVFFSKGSYHYYERMGTPTTSEWTAEKSRQLQKAYIHRWDMARNMQLPLFDQIAAWRQCLDLFVAECKSFPKSDWIASYSDKIMHHSYSWMQLVKNSGDLRRGICMLKNLLLTKFLNYKN